MVSVDYENDVVKIIDLLKPNHKITITEKYPFFILTNFSTEIFADGVLVAKVYKNLHNLCFTHLQYKDILIGTFHFNLRMCLINAIQARVNEDKETENLFYSMASHFIQMRRYYFDGTDVNYFNDTIFKDFSINCIGFTQSDKIDKADEFKKNAKEKKIVIFKYDPDQKDKVDLSKWVFDNSSGNPINNPKNYKIQMKDEDLHMKIEKPIKEGKEDKSKEKEEEKEE